MELSTEHSLKEEWTLKYGKLFWMNESNINFNHSGIRVLLELHK